MENAVDALKMGFGIFVFVIAIAIAVSVIGQARSASDVIFHFNDKTEFYTYITEEDVDSDSRIVGIETIIPTIYRYAKEQFAVTIYDTNGNPIVRYDLWTEEIALDWNKIYSEKDTTYNNIVNRLNSLQRVVDNTTGKTKTINANDIISKLYEVKINNMTSVGAPWLGDNEKILKRIEADMLEEKYENNSITYQGKGLLKKYKNKKFIEKFVEVTTSGETITDEEYSLETIKGNKKLEIIYIMQN